MCGVRKNRVSKNLQSNKRMRKRKYEPISKISTYEVVLNGSSGGGVCVCDELVEALEEMLQLAVHSAVAMGLQAFPVYVRLTDPIDDIEIDTFTSVLQSKLVTSMGGCKTTIKIVMHETDEVITEIMI